jgi:hypothetical protein
VPETKQTGRAFRVVIEPANSIKLYVPYHPDFVADLKAAVPASDRLWEPEDKHWWISSEFSLAALEIASKYFISADAFQDEWARNHTASAYWTNVNRGHSAGWTPPGSTPPKGGPKVYGDPGFTGWQERMEEELKKNPWGQSYKPPPKPSTEEARKSRDAFEEFMRQHKYDPSGAGANDSYQRYAEYGKPLPETDFARAAREARERDAQRRRDQAERERQQKQRTAPMRGGVSYSAACKALHLDSNNLSHPVEVIEASWRALVKLHHPDKGGDLEMMKTINQARDVLMKGRK